VEAWRAGAVEGETAVAMEIGINTEHNGFRGFVIRGQELALF